MKSFLRDWLVFVLTWTLPATGTILLIGFGFLFLERQDAGLRKFADEKLGRIEARAEDCDCTAVTADALTAIGHAPKSPTELASKGPAGVWFPQGPSWAENQPPSTVVRETKPSVLDTYEYESMRSVLGLRGMLDGKEVTYGLVLPAGLPKESTESLRQLLKDNIGGILYIWYLPTADKIAVVGGSGKTWEWSPKAP